MLKILETPGYICNHFRLLSQDRFDNVELPVRVENRRCSRYFEPHKRVWQTFEILLVKYACMFGFHDKHCSTSRFCLSMFKTSFCFPQVKTVCQAHTFVVAKLTSCLTSKISRLLNNACSFGRGFRRTVRTAF